MAQLCPFTGEKDPPYTFLRNEPTVFYRNLLCNPLWIWGLWLKFVREFGGFVLENEPTGEGF